MKSGHAGFMLGVLIGLGVTIGPFLMNDAGNENSSKESLPMKISNGAGLACYFKNEEGRNQCSDILLKACDVTDFFNSNSTGCLNLAREKEERTYAKP